MKEYWIDFSGCVKVEADNANEAESKFWSATSPFRAMEGFSNDVWDVDAVEEVVDFPSTINNPNAPNLQDLEDFWNDKLYSFLFLTG